jgi:RHS repeat-associated protein
MVAASGSVENGSFTLTGSCDVAYGANGVYAMKRGVTGTVTFNNATFGDPIPGVAKKGYWRTAVVGGAGLVVEKYTYSAYGKQTITAGIGGAVRAKSAVGFDRGFTGYIADTETGLLHARARQYSPTLGRFIGRDPAGYIDGRGLYAGYFVSIGVDPFGLAAIACPEGWTEVSRTTIPLDGNNTGHAHTLDITRFALPSRP